nr:carboxypeptidase-like regulatory domain-containing protein [Pontibacter sp. BAB1700]
MPLGSYTLQSSYIGYQPLSKFNVNVTSGNARSSTLSWCRLQVSWVRWKWWHVAGRARPSPIS